MSDRINIQNYEAFFLDYIEGNLDAGEIKELKRFLEEHPELKEELDSFEMFTLEPEIIHFNKKDKLTVNTNARSYNLSDKDYLCIASAEKDINKKEQEQLKEKIKNDDSILHELKIYNRTKLIPDESIVFKKKKELLKQRSVINLKVVSLAAAAVFAGVIALNISGLFNQSGNQQGEHLFSGIRINENAPVIKTVSNTENQSVQGALNSHNQTINNSFNNNDLVFADNEPQSNDNLYKELTISIPDIKREALIFSDENNDIENIYAYNTNKKNNGKEIIWEYAEKGVNVWKLISSSDLEMNNQYYADGSIEKLKISHPNFKLSRTFYKNKQ